MIIVMKPEVSPEAVEAAIIFFQRKGFTVQVRGGINVGQILIAVQGEGAENIDHLEIRRLAGVEDIGNNDIFIGLHKQFEEAWRYLAAVDRCERGVCHLQQA
jgi:hypothetical protein